MPVNSDGKRERDISKFQKPVAGHMFEVAGCLLGFLGCHDIRTLAVKIDFIFVKENSERYKASELSLKAYSPLQLKRQRTTERQQL